MGFKRALASKFGGKQGEPKLRQCPRRHTGIKGPTLVPLATPGRAAFPAATSHGEACVFAAGGGGRFTRTLCRLPGALGGGRDSALGTGQANGKSPGSFSAPSVSLLVGFLKVVIPTCSCELKEQSSRMPGFMQFPSQGKLETHLNKGR